MREHNSMKIVVKNDANGENLRENINNIIDRGQREVRNWIIYNEEEADYL